MQISVTRVGFVLTTVDVILSHCLWSFRFPKFLCHIPDTLVTKTLIPDINIDTLIEM